MSGRSFEPIIRYPEKLTEIFLVMHEQAYRPEGLEFDYMVGNLREDLDNNIYGRYLTVGGEERAKAVGQCIKDVKPEFIVTEDFATPRETARIIAQEAGIAEQISIIFDNRICESNLSYLSKSHFKTLVISEHEGDPNAAIRNWMQNMPDDFDRLIANHLQLWNEMVIKHHGAKFLYVLHVEGILLYLTLLLGLQPTKMCSLHIARSNPIHVRLFPDKDPVISFMHTNPLIKCTDSVFNSY